MTEYKKLYNQIDKLNTKIKKLETTIHDKKISKSTLLSYKINFPKESYSNKKYIGLKFDDNFNNYDSDTKSNNKNLISFIKLIKSNIIISYTLQLELDTMTINNVLSNNIFCSVAIGIKTHINSKIRIIKGSKYMFDLANSNQIDNKINISNTLLYSAEDGEELCMIVDFDFASGINCFVNSKKSIIKVLFV